MSVHVYGIVPSGSSPPEDLVGIDDQPVELVEQEGVAAVLGPADPERPLGRRADLLAHSRVLDAFAARGPVVPVRFGTVLGSAEEVLAELLVPNLEHFADLLAALRGRSQFTLRARYDEETVLAEIVAEQPQIASLREETRSRPESETYAQRIRLGELVSRALSEKREADAEAVLSVLTRHTESYDVSDGVAADDLIDVAFLVEDGQRETFTQAAEAVAESLAGRARLRLLGPLAPYSFVPAG